MKLKKILLSVILIAITVFCLKAQNTVKDDILKIKESFEKNSEYSVDIVYNLYSNYVTGSVSSTENAQYIKLNDKYYLKTENTETINGTDFKIMLYNEDKMMLLDDADKITNTSLGNISLDSLLLICKKLEFIKSVEGEKAINMDLGDNIYDQYNGISIFYDSETFFIKKIIMYYRYEVKLENCDKSSKPRLEVVYKKNSSNISFSSEIFNLKRYIKEDKTGIKVSENYKDYQLLDKRLNKNN